MLLFSVGEVVGHRQEIKVKAADVVQMSIHSFDHFLGCQECNHSEKNKETLQLTTSINECLFIRFEEVCSHIAGLLFKVEAATSLGMNKRDAKGCSISNSTSKVTMTNKCNRSRVTDPFTTVLYSVVFCCLFSRVLAFTNSEATT